MEIAATFHRLNIPSVVKPVALNGDQETMFRQLFSHSVADNGIVLNLFMFIFS